MTRRRVIFATKHPMKYVKHPAILELIISLEQKYSLIVTDEVKRKQDQEKLVPSHKSLKIYRDEQCLLFWMAVRRCLGTEVAVQRLRHILCHRRDLKQRRLYCKMGFDRNSGKVISYDEFFEKEPLLHANEKNAFGAGFSLEIHSIHRKLCHFIPYVTISQCSEEAGRRLARLHKDILRHKVKYKKIAKYISAHGGVPLLQTCMDGGKYSCKKKGILGSVCWSKFFKEDKELQTTAISVFQDVILSAFGSCTWYQYLMTYLQSQGHLSSNLIPGLPITSGFLSIGCQPNKYHLNARNFGVGILVVPRSYDGGEFVVTDPDFQKWRTVPLRKYDVIAGRFFRSNHYHLPCTDAVEHCTYSFYYDSRLADRRYVHVGENEKSS